jgi:hypothetical protein
MSKRQDTITKAYGNIPREPMFTWDFDLVPVRGLKFYWLKFLRKLQGR